MCLPILQASQCNAALQILSFYTKIKLIHICKFTLLYLQRIYFLFKNSPIIVRFLERNGALCYAAHFCVNAICITANNAVIIKYRTKKITPANIPTPRRFPTTYIRNRTVARRFCESSRSFLCPWNMCFHQQRCDYKI